MGYRFIPGVHSPYRCRTSYGRGQNQTSGQHDSPQPPTFLIDARLIATMGLMESDFSFPEPTDIATNGMVDFEY